MRARHLFLKKTDPSREKPRDCGNIVQMKNCTDDIVRRMSRQPLFKGCSVGECRELAERLDIRLRPVMQGEMVTSEVRAATEILCVLSGCFHVYECGLEDGARHLVQRLSVGDTFGTSFPVLTLTASPALLLAETEGELLLIDVQATRQLIETASHPKFVANLYAATAKQGFYAWRKLRLLSCYEVSNRILLYLRWREEDGRRDPLTVDYPVLAAYLGVNRTSLYRALAALRKARRIRQVGTSIVLSPEGQTPV